MYQINVGEYMLCDSSISSNILNMPYIYKHTRFNLKELIQIALKTKDKLFIDYIKSYYLPTLESITKPVLFDYDVSEHINNFSGNLSQQLNDIFHINIDKFNELLSTTKSVACSELFLSLLNGDSQLNTKTLKIYCNIVYYKLRTFSFPQF